MPKNSTFRKSQLKIPVGIYGREWPSGRVGIPCRIQHCSQANPYLEVFEAAAAAELYNLKSIQRFPFSERWSALAYSARADHR